MLFQKNIVKKYIGLLDEELTKKAWEQYSSYFLNEDIQANKTERERIWTNNRI